MEDETFYLRQDVLAFTCERAHLTAGVDAGQLRVSRGTKTTDQLQATEKEVR